MEDKKQYCENLYKEYLELKSKAQLRARITIHNKDGSLYIKPEDLRRRHEIKKELVEKCKPYLNLKSYQWFEIGRLYKK